MENNNELEQTQVDTEQPVETPTSVTPEPAKATDVTPPEAKRNDVEDPVSDVKQFDYKAKEITPSLALPNDEYNKILDFVRYSYGLSEEAVYNLFSETNIAANTIIENASKNTTLDSTYSSNLNNPEYEYDNKIVYGDKKLTPNTLKLKSRSGNVTGHAAIAAFSAALGVGENVEVPLWHSGFWVALRPPRQAEIVSLQASIANSAVELGRATNTAVFSNYGVVANRIIVDFIKTHIVYTTLDCEVDDLFDHICCQDLQALVLGLAISMFPKGTQITRTCKNATKIDDNGAPKCDYIVTGTIDPKKLLFVNRKALTTEHFITMGKKAPKTVSIDEAAEYKRTLRKLADKNVEFDTGDAKTVFTLSLPSVAKYVRDGELWVNEIINRAEAIFQDTDGREAKEKKVDSMLSAFTLGLYSTFITEIRLGDIVATDQATVLALLEQLSTDGRILTTYIKEMRDYISETAIAVVATPSYTCPKCKEEQSPDENSDFKNLIPLNMVETFFDLCALRELKARKAIMS